MDKNEALEESNEVTKDFKFTVEPSRRKSVKKAKVIIEGKLTIYNAALLLEKLKEVAAEYHIIDFRLIAIEEIDVSTMQTLYFFKHFYFKDTQRISYQIENPPKEIRAILTKTKYQSTLFKKPSNVTA